MKQPNAIAYLFGNQIVFFILGCITVLVGLAAFAAPGLGVPAIFMLCLTGWATACNRQVTAYSKWKREWEGMNGPPAKQPAKLNLAWLRYAAGLGAWLLAASFIISTPDAASGPLFAIFWLGSLAGGAGLVFRAMKKPRRAKVSSGEVVTVCVGLPMQSPPKGSVESVLPAYCRQILR